MSIYQYFSAVCGSGKTHQFINHACEWANNGRKIIIFLPTKELIKETIEHFLLNRPNAPITKVFHGDVVSTSVSRELTDYLKNNDGKGQIIFTTKAVLPYLPTLSIRKYWHCFVDEAPQVFQHFSYDASGTEVANRRTKKPPHENDMRFLHRTSCILLRYGSVPQLVGKSDFNCWDHNPKLDVHRWRNVYCMDTLHKPESATQG